MANKYPNSGIISDAKTRIHPNSPDMNGDITIDKSLVNELMNEQEGNEVKIRLSGWRKEGAYGSFISLRVNTYKKPEEQLSNQHLSTLPDTKNATPVDDSDIPF
jgi:hypothetical protein